MLVVDLDSLETVDFLDLIDQVTGKLFLALDRQYVVGVDRSVHQRLPGEDAVSFLNAHVLPLGDEVFLRFTHLGRDYDPPLPFHIFSVRNGAVDLGDNGILLRLPRLEELGDPRQTPGDILGLRRFPRDLGDDVAGDHLVAFRNHDVRPYGKKVPRHGVRPGDAGCFALLIFDRNTGPQVGVRRLYDHLAGKTRDFVELLLHGLAFDDVAEFHGSRDFGEDRDGERIPFRDAVSFLDLPAVRHSQACSVGNGVLAAPPSLFIDDVHFATAVHDHQAVVPAPHHVEVLETDGPVMPGFQCGLLLEFGRASDMESPHGQLRPRLSDGLGRDDTHRLADVHQMAVRKVAAVTLRADAVS